MPDQPQPRQRIDPIDIARGVALLAMAVYHLAWDLEFFGYVEPGLTAVGGWKLFARSIASGFLFLAGVSLYLAHANGIRWPRFTRRLAMVAGAALAISVASYLAVPDGFIFFGILHQIALASILGLAFLRLPALLTLLVAALVVAAPHFLRSPTFDPAWFWWTGLSQTLPRSNDYVPVFPWFGAILAGIAATKIAVETGLTARLAEIKPGRWARPAIFAGRHSLAVYLIHQPMLIAGVWIFAQIMPPQTETPQVRFLQSCETACSDTRDTEFCTRYCACMIDRLDRDNAIEGVFSGDQSPQLQSRLEDAAQACTIETDNRMLEGN